MFICIYASTYPGLRHLWNHIRRSTCRSHTICIRASAYIHMSTETSEAPLQPHQAEHMSITYLALTDTAVTAADRGRVPGVTFFCGNLSLASRAPATAARTPTRSTCMARGRSGSGASRSQEHQSEAKARTPARSGCMVQVPPGSGASHSREHHGPMGGGVMTCIEGGVGQMWLVNVVAEGGGGRDCEGAPPLVSCMYVCVCMCVIHIYLYTYMYICTYVCMYVCMYICIYIV